MSRVYVSRILECLRELADKAYQQRIWTASSGPEISSFTEAVCQLFDDSGLGDELDKSRTVFSAMIDARLRVLGDELVAFDDNRAPSEIIEDPKMEKLRVLARELLDLLSDEGIR